MDRYTTMEAIFKFIANHYKTVDQILITDNTFYVIINGKMDCYLLRA